MQLWVTIMKLFFRKIIDDVRLTHPSFLIVGLGNPGREYRNNRHNIGFMLVDRLAERLEVTFSRVESKSLVTKAKIDDLQLILAKPQTFMNLSGQAVGGLARFYKIPHQRLMVAYDDIDLPFGTLRIRPAGGSGGHKGMKSIIEKLNTEDFPRLRLGISRPSGRKEASGHVLQDFSNPEQEWLPDILEKAVDAVLLFTSQGLEHVMNQYNSSLDVTAD